MIDSGGLEFVSSGGVTELATISGGTLEVASGGITSGAVSFAGGGTLELDASQTFSGAVAGFGGSARLDLSDIAFGAHTTLGFAESGNNASGTLTISDGTHTAAIALFGQYIAGQFQLAGDGHGGTLVTDPSVTVATASALLATPHA